MTGEHTLDYRGRAAYSPDVIAVCTCGNWRYQAKNTHNALQESTAFNGYELGIKVSQAFTRHLGAMLIEGISPSAVGAHDLWSKISDWDTKSS